jgi:Tetratricopeptide repeat.
MWGDIGSRRFVAGLIVLSTALVIALTPINFCSASEFKITPAIKGAYLLEKHGQLTEACAGYEKVCNSNPKYFEAWFLAGRGYHNLHQYSKARTSLETAHSLRPDETRCLKLLGETLLALGKPADAKEVLNKAIKLNPNVSGLYGKFLTAEKADDGQDAVRKALKDLISKGEKERNAAMLAGCGSYYVSEGNAVEAIKCFQQALNIDPKLPAAYTGLAEAYEQRGEYNDATAAMETGIKYSADQFSDHVKLAMLNIKNKNPQKALECLDKAIEFDREKEPMILSIKARVLIVAGKYSEALDTAKRAIATGSETCETYLYCVKSLYEMRRMDEAKSYMDAAIASAKTAADYRNCGDQLVKFNDVPRALAFMDQALQLDPSDGASYARRGVIYASRNQQMKALADLSKAIELNKRDAGARRARAQLYITMKRDDDARNDMTVALALERNPNEILRLAAAEKKAGQYDSANAILQKAAEIAPDNVIFRRKKAKLHEEMKQYDKAIEEYTECIKRYPKDAMLYSRRGDNYGRLGKETEKLIDMTEVLRLHPSAKKYEARARFYLEVGRTLSCIDDCKTALELPDVDRRAVLYVKACAYKELNDFKSAIASCTEGIKAKPEDGAHYALRGGLYAKTNQLDLALKDMDAAIRLSKKNPEMWYSRGEIHSRMKKYDKAVEDFETALKLENHPRYEQALQEARKKAGL